jgi:hypothetical protein
MHTYSKAVRPQRTVAENLFVRRWYDDVVRYLVPSDGGEYAPDRYSQCLGEHDSDIVPRRVKGQPVVLIVGVSHSSSAQQL